MNQNIYLNSQQNAPQTDDLVYLICPRSVQNAIKKENQNKKVIYDELELV